MLQARNMGCPQTIRGRGVQPRLVNRIPQVHPVDVVIHFPEPEPLIETDGDDLPF